MKPRARVPAHLRCAEKRNRTGSRRGAACRPLAPGHLPFAPPARMNEKTMVSRRGGLNGRLHLATFPPAPPAPKPPPPALTCASALIPRRLTKNYFVNKRLMVNSRAFS
jgi:hypothetical protein